MNTLFQSTNPLTKNTSHPKFINCTEIQYFTHSVNTMTSWTISSNNIFLLSSSFCVFYWPNPVADPGFPMGGCNCWGGGCGPPTQALFGENVCKNERIGSHREWRAAVTTPLDPSMQSTFSLTKLPVHMHCPLHVGIARSIPWQHKKPKCLEISVVDLWTQ